MTDKTEDVFPRDYDAFRVIELQPETFVFVNESGAVVIRQVAEIFDDHPFVHIRPEFAERLCAAIMAAARESQQREGQNPVKGG